MCVFRLLDLLQTVTENVPLEENVPLKFVGESFGLQVQTVMVDPETPLVPDLSSIADSIANNSNMRPPLAKIALPGSAVPSSTALRVSAALHADDSLFQQRNNTQLFSSFTKVGSVIASLTIIRNGEEISDLEDAVRITLGKADQEVKHCKVIGCVNLNFSARCYRDSSPGVHSGIFLWMVRNYRYTNMYCRSSHKIYMYICMEACTRVHTVL